MVQFPTYPHRRHLSSLLKSWHRGRRWSNFQLTPTEDIFLASSRAGTAEADGPISNLPHRRHLSSLLKSWHRGSRWFNFQLTPHKTFLYLPQNLKPRKQMVQFTIYPTPDISLPASRAGTAEVECSISISPTEDISLDSSRADTAEVDGSISNLPHTRHISSLLKS